MAKKSEFITKDYLDKSFKEYSEAIIEAVDFGFKQVSLSFEENKKEHKRLEKKMERF